MGRFETPLSKSGAKSSANEMLIQCGIDSLMIELKPYRAAEPH
jgi:hypothetical protein